MVPHVLGVGYAYNEYEVTAGRWKEFEIEFTDEEWENNEGSIKRGGFEEWYFSI